MPIMVKYPSFTGSGFYFLPLVCVWGAVAKVGEGGSALSHLPSLFLLVFVYFPTPITTNLPRNYAASRAIRP